MPKIHHFRPALFILLALWAFASFAAADNLEAISKARTLALKGNFDGAMVLLKPLADSGDPEAMLGIGKLYWDALGTARDNPLAREWLNKAALIWNERANNGDPRAYTSLGIMVKDGLGYKKDKAQAQKLFTIAFDLAQPRALQGDMDSQYLLGAFYMNGRGVSKDVYAGADWLSKAGEAGHRTAMKMLVYIFDCGCRGLTKDDTKAEYWRAKQVASR